MSACLLSTAKAQFVQQGGKLVGTGASEGAWQGRSVSVSADGNTAIVGGWNDTGQAGAAWVFTRSGGVWSQQGGKLHGAGATGISQQGTAVAISGDGNTAIIGGPNDNFYAGAVWIFTRSGGVWTQQGGKLVGTGSAGGIPGQGSSVAISGDGNTAIVGGLRDNTSAGAAWVFTRSGGAWSQQGNKLVGTGAAGSAWQGCSVAISADGNTAIVGGEYDDNSKGAAWVYTRTSGVWRQQGGKLVGTGAVGSAEQGWSVALSANGNTAIVGGIADDTSLGAAWIFTRAGGVWAQQGAKLVGTDDVGIVSQGNSVSLSGDGNTAIVGGHNDNASAGATWVFTRSGGVWSQQGSKLVGTGAVGAASQGHSVSLSADGSTALVGGVGDNNYAGAAWVFARNVSNPTAPSIAAGGVLNGASFLPGIAPGTWISIFGSNLSGTTRMWNDSDFVGNNLPTQLDGVSVTVDGQPAYVYYISPAQLNVLAPASTAQGQVAVQVTAGQVKSNVANADQSTFSPGLFTYSKQGISYVAGNRADGADLSKVAAKPGDIIVLFGTGFGATNPASPIGQIVSAARLANPVTVWIGGVIATQQFAGIVGAGLYQFNVVVPNVSNGDNAVAIDIGGSSTQPNVFLTVQR